MTLFCLSSNENLGSYQQGPLQTLSGERVELESPSNVSNCQFLPTDSRQFKNPELVCADIAKFLATNSMRSEVLDRIEDKGPYLQALHGLDQMVHFSFLCQK